MLARTVALCFVAMVCDCFDVLVLAVVARPLIADWQIDSTTMGALLTVGTFGLLVGSVAFGWIGDRIGRRRAVVWGCGVFSVTTILIGFVSSPWELAALRFIAALGLGGAFPNAVALVSENAPKRHAATCVGIVFAGYSVGGILVGVVASFVLPSLGWQWMFFIGGGVSLVATVVFQFFLPESLPYLAEKPGAREDAVALARKFRPDMELGPDTEFSVSDKTDRSASPGDLFAGDLKVITPLLWAIYISSSATAAFLASWLPATAETLGLSPQMAPIAFAALFGGATVGGVIGGRFVDRWGTVAIVPLALVSFPAAAALGLLTGAPNSVLILSAIVGLLAFGCQAAVIAVVGTFYPVSIRATGVGWAVAVAKFGAMAGSYSGGVLITYLSVGWVFLFGALPLIIVALLVLALRGFRASSAVRLSSGKAWSV